MNRRIRKKAWLVFAAAAGLIAQSGSDRYPFVRDGKVGFIDARGKEVIAPQFAPIGDMAHFNDGLAPVMGPDGAGYIDSSGRFVIGPSRQWGQPRPFHEGVAAVLIWGEAGAPNTTAFIDLTGRIIAHRAGVSEHGYFEEGLMPSSDGRRWGFVDRNFAWAIPAKYDFAEAFSEGLAPVEAAGKWGYIDRTGREVVPPRFDLAWRFSDGIGRIRMDAATGEKSTTVEGLRPVLRYRFGFVDASWREVVPPMFEEATDFHDGRAFAKPPGSRRFGIIDRQGDMVHPPEFDQAGEFHQGLAAVCINGRWGYVDVGGRWRIAPAFRAADGFSGELARVAWDDGYGYIDRTGAVVWKTASQSPRE